MSDNRLLESPSSIAGSARSTPAIQQLEHDIHRRFSQPNGAQHAPPAAIDPRIPHHILLHHGAAPSPQRSRSVAPQKKPPAKPRQNRKNRALSAASKPVPMSESEYLFSLMPLHFRQMIFTLCKSSAVEPYQLPPHTIRQLASQILQLVPHQVPQSTAAQTPSQKISQVPPHNLQQVNLSAPPHTPAQMQTQMNSQAPPQNLQEILQLHQAAQLAPSSLLALQEPQRSVQGNPPSILQQMAHQIQQLNPQPTPSPAPTRMATPLPHWNLQQMSQQAHQLESRSAFSPLRSRMASPIPQRSLQQTPQQMLQQIAQQIGTQIPQPSVQQDAQQILQQLSQQVRQLNAQSTFSPLHAQMAFQAAQKDPSRNPQQILQQMSQQVRRLDAPSPAPPQMTSPVPQENHEQIVRQIIQQFFNQVPQSIAQSMSPQQLTQLLQQISHQVPSSVAQTCPQVTQQQSMQVPQQMSSQMVTQNTVTVPMTVVESKQPLTINAPEVQLPKEISSTESRILDKLNAVKIENLDNKSSSDADLKQQRIAKLELTEEPAEPSTSQTLSAEDDALQGLLMMMKQDQFSQSDRQSSQPVISNSPTTQSQRLQTPSLAAQKKMAMQLQKEQKQQQKKQAQLLKQQQQQEQKRQKQLQQQQRQQQLLEQRKQQHLQQVYHQQWLQQQQQQKQQQQNQQIMLQKQHQHQLELQRLQQIHKEQQQQQQLAQQQNLLHVKAQQQDVPRPPPAHSVPIGMDPRLLANHGMGPKMELQQLSFDPRLPATDPQRFGLDPKLFGTDVRQFLSQLNVNLPPGTDLIQFLSQFQSLAVHRPPNQNPVLPPETTMPVVSSTQSNSAAQLPGRPQENETHAVDAAQSNGLSPEELAKSLFTSQASKPVTPNILRKPRGNEVNTSSFRLADHPLFGSTIPPSAQSLSGLAQSAVPAAVPAVQPPTLSAPDTPRRRKQILVSDDHHQSTLLNIYPQVNDDFDSIKNIIDAVADPSFVPSSSGEQSYGFNINCVFPSEVPINEAGQVDETVGVQRLTEDEVINLVSPQKKKSHKAKKDPQPRGRPRKNCANQLPFAQPLPQIQAPLVATGIDELAELQSVIYRRKSKNDANHAEDEEEERERQALLEGLPTNLRNQLKKEKEGRKKGSKKNSISGGAIVPPTESFEEELSTDAALSYLDSMTTTDPRSFLAGLDPNMFGKSESPDFPPEVVTSLLENFILTLEQPLIKSQQDEEPAKVEEPLATFFAVDGVQLCILYENPPTIGLAPIWSDNPGPLLPQEWYQDGKKIKRRQMLTHPGLIKLLEEIERSKNLPPKEPVFKPKIVTKAALKWMPESMQITPEFTAPLSPASLKRKMVDTDSDDSFQQPAKVRASDVEMCGEVESDDTIFQPPGKVKASEKDFCREVESDDNFQPPVVKEPSDPKLCEKVERDDTFFHPPAEKESLEIEYGGEVESDDTFQPCAVKDPSEIEFFGNVESDDTFFEPPGKAQPSKIDFCQAVDSDDTFQPPAKMNPSEIECCGNGEPEDTFFQPPAEKEPSEMEMCGENESDDTFQLPAKVNALETELCEKVKSDDTFFQPPAQKELSVIKMCGNIDLDDTFQPPGKVKPSEIAFCGEDESYDTFFQPSVVMEPSETQLCEKVESDDISFQPPAQKELSEIKMCGNIDSDDTFQLPVKPSEIELCGIVGSDDTFFHPPAEKEPLEIELSGEVESDNTFFRPPAEKKLSEIELCRIVESEDTFQSPAEVMPSEIALCGVVESVPEPLNDSTPVNEGPFKIERVTVQKFKSKKKKNSIKKLWFRTVKSLHKLHTDLQVFTSAIFETIKSEGTREANAISSLEKHQVAEDVNRKLNSIVRDCATAAFKYVPNALLCRTGESTVTEFTIDSTNSDSGSRWCSWHEALVNSCVKNVRSKLVADKLKKLRRLVKPANRWLRSMKDPNLKKEASENAMQIRKIYKTLDNKMNEFKKLGQLQLHRTFELTYRAIEERTEKWIAVRKKYREVELEREIVNWKIAATCFIGALQRGDQNKLWPQLKKLCDSVFHSIQTHDAVVDVCMFASRLQSLYHHAQEVFSDKIDVAETHKVLQSLEDTEHLFILAETKVLLLQMGAKAGMIQLIDAYFQGDAVNVEKGRLRRLMMSKAHPQVREKCAEKMKIKGKLFVESCNVLGLKDIVRDFPCGNWETVIKKEEEHWRKTEKLGRHNFFKKSLLENFDYALEIPPILLSKDAVNHTLTQMFMTLPQRTSLVDENFKSIADADKREPKMYIQSIVPLFRMQPEAYQIPRCILNTRKRPHEEKTAQELPSKKSFEQLATSGTVENGENSVPLNRDKHGERQSDEKTLGMLKNIQRRKMDQELKRMQNMESAFKNVLLSEGNVVEKRVEEFGSNDLPNMKTEYTRGIKSNATKTEHNIPPPEQEKVVSSDPEFEDDVKLVFQAIKCVSRQKEKTSNQKGKKSKRQEVEFLTERFVHLQKVKAASLQSMTSRMQNNWPRTVTVADPRFEQMLDFLEFYDGYGLDKMDAVDFENERLRN